MNKFKLRFSNPIITIQGKKTIMKLRAYFNYDNKLIVTKKFTKSIICHKDDKYDLNKAVRILQASIEQTAYIWAKKIIDNEIKKEQNTLNNMISFSEKADYIITHDSHYLNKLLTN